MSRIQEQFYEEMLDNVYGTVKIAGFEYNTSYALKNLDPIAYREGFLDYLDGQDEDEE